MRRFAPWAAAACIVLGGAAALSCDGGLQPEPVCAPGLVGICGSLRFRGTIPDSTDNVFVAAYATFPQTCDDLIFGRQPLIPGSVPYTDSVAAYSMAVPAGGYAWVLAIWKKIGTLRLTPADTAILRVAGYYRNAADSSQPGSIVVPAGGAAGDVDFRVEFDSLRPATDFVSC